MARYLSEEDKARAFNTVLRHDAFVVPSDGDARHRDEDWPAFLDERPFVPRGELNGRPITLSTSVIRRRS